MLRRVVALVATGLAFAPAGACWSDDPEPPQGTNEQRQRPAGSTVPAENATATLFVSNQSFDRPRVALRVLVDGSEAITGDFDVEGQHTWLPFPLQLSDGAHELLATAEDGATHRLTVEVPPGGRRFVVLSYWYDDGDARGHFTADVRSEPPAFG